jgi:hypothetical protein
VATLVTAKIRAERSAQKLGFSVPVRARIVLSDEHQDAWALVERDVLSGNNVVGATVSYGADEAGVTIVPEPTDA